MWINSGRRLVILCFFGFMALNALAYWHARAMTTFVDTSVRTASPEDLGFLSKLKILFTGVKVPRPENAKTPASYSLRFESHQYAGGNETTLEAWHIPVDGSDTLFLLFHGYASSKESLLPVASKLSDMGYGSLLVDFFGSGGSDGSGTSIGYFEATDVVHSLTYAKKRWPDVKHVLYGQSMGAVALLRAVSAHNINPDGIVVESIYDKMVSTAKNRFVSMGVPATPFAEVLVFWGGLRLGFNAFTHNPVDYAGDVVIPSLVLQGELDPRATTDQARDVYDRLGGWKRFSEYRHAGHLAALESDITKWQQDIDLLITEIRDH